MIHFFTKFGSNPQDTPFGRALAASGARYRLFGASVPMHYASRLELLFVRLPGLARTALRWARQSLLGAHPYPYAVVVGSDIEVLAFALVRLLRLRPRRPSIVYLGFIYTARRNPTQEALRRAYYRFVLRFVACAICHSTLETERYAALFPGRVRFAFVPWGTDLAWRAELLRAGRRSAAECAHYIVAAGKSGRDYPTLFRAMADVPLDLHVICDYGVPIEAVPKVCARIEILGNCYDKDYLRQLFEARFVVIPLRVEDISAGQMVLIQSMLLGKPVIITETPTILEYVQPEQDAVLVKQGDVAGLRAAILRLCEEDGLCDRLGAAAMASYERRFTTEAYIANVLSVVEGLGRLDGNPERALASDMV